ncbi:hypothetical protein EJ04DRAFT_516111 [Polyplosphaeria fusca]|uniref:Uncharacterized protein n=1 Tax=Polyplosphaeria fusca TaxID=682080 RepID=A0A9P4QMD6_9PLEO|nr:hypothetical protein EJ04DRAFT_516111 [Polyplosphaeria fusca]
MDTMRSLNTSLPNARSLKAASQQDVHQSFRTAALTVTNLYKSALADLDKSRAEGYQEALEELIGFLDKQNLGVGDGEGWRIRQWAMERVDGALPGHTASESDEETAEEKRARSSSPILDHTAIPDDTRSSEPPQVESAQRSDSAPPVPAESNTSDTDMPPPPPVFHFSSPHSYPVNYSPDPVGSDISAAARRAFASPRRNSTRSGQRHSLHRSAASNLFQLGSGAGQKRKLLEEFFNVDGFNDRRDRGGGPKRGRTG